MLPVEQVEYVGPALVGLLAHTALTYESVHGPPGAEALVQPEVPPGPSDPLPCEPAPAPTGPPTQPVAEELAAMTLLAETPGSAPL